MKKLALILALMIIPCTAFGLEMLNDDAMDQVTGQSGVHIAFDDVQMFINIEKLAWIDCDGLDNPTSCTGGPGAIAINDFQIDVLNINAIVSTDVPDGTSTTQHDTNQTAAGVPLQLYSVACGDIPLFYDYGATGVETCYLSDEDNPGSAGLDNYTSISTVSRFTAQAVTIDATDRLPALTAGMTNNAGSLAGDVLIGGVYIGLPTVEIFINSMSLRPVFDGDIGGSQTLAWNDDDNTNALATNFGVRGADFGVIYMEGITVSILSGWMEIAPH